jgi:ABC-type multidrug transport system ATPase subunit
MEGAFVEFKHVYAGYGSGSSLEKLLRATPSSHTTVLRDLTFSLASHDQVVIFGPGGSGKSTLLRLIAGSHIAHEGTIVVNGKRPGTHPSAKDGYVCVDYANRILHGTVQDVLLACGKAHKVDHLPSRIGEVTKVLGIEKLTEHKAQRLSTTERIRVELACAALSDAPVLLLDDIADVLEPGEIKRLLSGIFAGRCTCIATRNVAIAESLELPILLLHGTSLVHHGSRESIAHEAGINRMVDAWVEGLRYDLLRKLRSHPGVLQVQLLPTDQFDGSRLRITMRNSRYLPSLYDVISQAQLVHIEELPPSLSDIVGSLS